MRKSLLLCLLMIVSTYIYSQNTSTITINSDQLKTANLIFAEHQKLLETVPLLENKIINLEQINKSWEITDSIQRTKLVYYNDIIEDKNKRIDKLNNSLKRKQKIVRYGTAGSCMLILLCLLTK